MISSEPMTNEHDIWAAADSFANGIDGWSQGSAQDVPSVPAALLARRTQSTDFHQRPRRTYEHGRAMETAH